MKYILFFIFHIVLMTNCLAQEQQSNDTLKLARVRYVGINVTPLVTQFIPLNRTNPRVSGPYNFIYKRFNAKNVGLILAAGVDVLQFGVSESNFHLNLRIGWENKQTLYQNWQYAFGMSAIWSMGNFNTAGAASTDENINIGIAPTFSFGYVLNDVISFGTESLLFIGLINDNNDSLGISFVPPVAMYLNFKLTNKRKQSLK